MKVIVQIPCFNEEDTLPQVVAEIPRVIEGVERVEILVIDDGSSDRTVEVAREIGVEHVVRHRRNNGLARSFRTGIERCLALGADIIVNTDGDNQYAGADIPRLIAPILAGEADIVVGDREPAKLPHFSPLKRRLQALGSFVVRQLSGTDVPDAVSGFRAISREAALNLNIISSFSYTIEMLIQAGRKRMAIASVPIRAHPVDRRSRLFKSLPGFLRRSGSTMLRMYSMYQPLRAFFYIGLTLTAAGSLPILRFLYFYTFVGQGEGKLQSLVLGGVLVVIGLTTFLIGLLADLVSFNRQLIEMTLEKVRRIELAQSGAAAGDINALKARVERLAADGFPEGERATARPEAAGPVRHGKTSRSSLAG
ncbi:MAG: glycosyltransferase family 2 protein [Kiloniellales bacterium]